MSATKPFRAFVSYCHKDKAFAAWLQRRLESYRLPRHLADKVEPLPGQASGRIGPVFRDREDLSAASDLSAAVREAITASSALVVVASPDAAKSQWVAREIALFREMHPGAPILVALARGEPSQALPEALHRDDAEPLCADFRKAGDGKRLAFLKIVAGLSDLDLDALVQRDAQRQVRRVMALTLGAAILMVIMALLLVAALQARSEAERQRSEAEHQRAGAEGLVEYMLTDLRERLKGVGRSDVMSAVSERAMAYYTSQGDLSQLSDASLERRSRVLHAMGEDDDNRGELARASAKFVEAHRTTAAILARATRDPDRIFAHAQSEYWVGYAEWRRRDRQGATRHWLAYLRQAAALAAVERGSIRSQIEQSYAEGNLCDLDFHGAHDLPGASRHCQAAVEFMKAAAGAAPNDRKISQDLANRYGWMARVQLARKDHAGSIASREAEIALLERLLAVDPENLEYIKRRAWPDIGLAETWIDTNLPDKAAILMERRWPRLRPYLTDKATDQFWDTGLRYLFFLSKAQRKAGLDNSSAKAETDIFLDRHRRLFPGREVDMAILRRQIEQ